MDIKLKDVPVGTIVELGGDTEKRQLYVGEISNGFGKLWKSKQDHIQGKPWQVMAATSSRIKHYQLP